MRELREFFPQSLAVLRAVFGLERGSQALDTLYQSRIHPPNQVMLQGEPHAQREKREPQQQHG